MAKHQYTLIEEVYNTATHTAGSLICSFLLGILICTNVYADPTPLKLVGCCAFGISSIIMFVCSSLYHAIIEANIKEKLRLFDHLSIYCLMFGTFIPIVLDVVIPTNPVLGWSFALFQLCLIIGGVIFKIFSKHNYSMVSTIIYCILGWSVALIFIPIMNNMSRESLTWLIAGGFAYTIGVPFYVLKQYKWTHSIWHVFVLIGVICHYMMMFTI